MNIKNISNFIKKENILDYISFIRQFIITILIYGILVSFVLKYLIEIPITFGGIFSYGFLIYFLKYEVPIIIKASIPDKRR